MQLFTTATDWYKCVPYTECVRSRLWKESRMECGAYHLTIRELIQAASNGNIEVDQDAAGAWLGVRLP